MEKDLTPVGLHRLTGTPVCAKCHYYPVASDTPDRSKPLQSFQGRDGLTSTVSYPTVWGKYCFYCAQKVRVEQGRNEVSRATLFSG